MHVVLVEAIKIRPKESFAEENGMVTPVLSAAKEMGGLEDAQVRDLCCLQAAQRRKEKGKEKRKMMMTFWVNSLARNLHPKK